MGIERQRTKHIGVYQRTSSERTFNGRPDVCFDITYKVGNRKVWEKVGWRSEGYTAAMAFAVRSDRLRANRHSDVFPVSIPPITLDSAWGKYLKDHLAGKSSEKMSQSIYSVHVQPALGGKSLHDISSLDIDRLCRAVMEAGLSEQTAKHALSLVRRIMRRCLDWNLWVGPMPRITMPKVDNARHRFLTRPEADALLEELGRKSLQVRRYAEVSLHTGLRIDEIFSLRGYSLDMHAGIIHVDGKDGKRRQAFMTPTVRKIFEEIKPKPGDFVFMTREGRRVTEISQSYNRAVNALGFNDGVTDRRAKVVFHTLRHTYASWLAMDGVPLYTIGRLLGHANEKMTARYSHLCPDTLRDAAMRIQAIVDHES